MTKSRGLFGTAIVPYLIIAIEVLMMISPLAAFCYAACNPVLRWFAHWPAMHALVGGVLSAAHGAAPRAVP